MGLNIVTRAGKNRAITHNELDSNFVILRDAVDSLILTGATEQSLLVINKTGAQISRGQVVYAIGASANYVSIALAKADAEATSSTTLGITEDIIIDGAVGYVRLFGYVDTLDTNIFSIGETIYLSDSVAGGITNVGPSSPSHLIKLGIITVSDFVNGIIAVQIQNGYEIEELHNVHHISALSNEDILAWNVANSRYENHPHIATANPHSGSAANGVNTDITSLNSTVMTSDPTVNLGIATKQFVEALVTGLLDYKGGYDATTNTPDLDTSPLGILKGDTYTVTVGGNFFAEVVEAGDIIIAEIDSPTVIGGWTVVNKNLPYTPVNIAGDDMTGNLGIVKTGNATLTLDSSDGLGNSQVNFVDSGFNRWVIQKDGISNNLVISRYNAAGVFQDSPFIINEATGNIVVTGTVDGRDIAADGTAQDGHIGDVANPHAVTQTHVGLGNVDNTSDATKNTAVATLTNKTITGGLATADPTVALGLATKQYAEKVAIEMAIALGS